MMKKFIYIFLVLFMLSGGSSMGSSIAGDTAVAAPSSWHQILPVAERFELVMGGVAVLDKETGLVWEQTPDPNVDPLIGWVDSVKYCFKLVKPANRMGWRLPTVEEWASLFDPTQTAPSLPSGHPFTLFNPTAHFWTATSFFVNPGPNAWHAHILDSHIHNAPKETNNEPTYPWCVRGGHGYNAFPSGPTVD